MYFIKISFFLILNNIYSCKKYYNYRKKKSNKIDDKNNNSENENKEKENIKNVEFKQFNKDFKFTFLKNALFQHNNNCTLNAVFSSLFNFPQVQNLLIYNDFDDKLLISTKKLLEKAINENNQNKAINYIDIYNDIVEFLKKNHSNVIDKGKFSDSVNTSKFLQILNDYKILIYIPSGLNNFINYELQKQYFISKDNLVKIINNGINNHDFKNILKNNNIVKLIYKELKYYDKICKIIDNLNFNRNNTGRFQDGENIIDSKYDINKFIFFTNNNNEENNLFLDLTNIIVVPENKNVKEYIKNLVENQEKDEKENILKDFYHFNYIYDKILEDKKIELELISINFIDPDYHIFTINKNINDNKWYIFDDLTEENGIEADFEKLLKNGFFIEKKGHKYIPEFFYFNARLKK